MTATRLRSLALAFFLACLATPLWASNYTIGTGSQSGTYFPLGGALAQVWTDSIPGFTMRAEVTAASVENIIKVSAGQQLAGLAMGDAVLAAVNGEPPFRQPMEVAVLFALYPNVVQIIVPANSSIHGVADLRGKRVSVGAPGSGTRVGALAVLDALGIGQGDFRPQNLDYTATTEALSAGQIDAGILIGSAGVGAITELALNRPVRILSFSEEELAKVQAAQPAYTGTEVPEGTYHRVPAFTAPAVWNVLVVREDLDADLAGQMLEAAFSNRQRLVNTVADARHISLAIEERLDGVPLHPAGIAYRAARAEAE